ncbi:mitochondrial import inner membrane translocase subunit TIM50-C-like isoform X2 [Stegodyphus dumicola]|uniref:mitochondrial import inner membrane translocase subunit TIM50-C-like isoform X2 n=1 Tax=Stegodyphus dumicola TaxID=202533 RepID=UPI0015A8C950|nr:mitochondrial import inner membrane translocase subunit TIM50-C-like isoform X2 [Stegodyphus dumicola]
MAARSSMCLSRLLKAKCSKFMFASSSTRQISFVKHVKRPSVFISSGSLKYCINSTAVFSTRKSNNVKILSEDILKATRPKQTSTGNDDGQSKNSEEDKKSDAFSKKAMKYTFIAFGSMFTGFLGIAIYEWGAPPRDENGNPVEDEYNHMSKPKAYLYRTYNEMMYYNKLIKEPSREKLLPEPLTEPYYQPPYTLALELTGVLVHPDWTYQTGWRFKKRPGVDYFLQQAGPPLFEVVIYTSEQGFTAFPIIDSLDPNGYIMYRLFRDATRYMDGHHVKDLSCLNRDLSKVIFVDWNEKSFKLQPRNALHLKRWTGNDDDTTLYDLATLLRAIATSEVEDVRTVLDYYSQFDDPVQVFKDNQRKLQSPIGLRHF